MIMSDKGCGGWPVQRLQVQQQHWKLRHGAGEAEHVMLSCDHCHVTAEHVM